MVPHPEAWSSGNSPKCPEGTGLGPGCASGWSGWGSAVPAERWGRCPGASPLTLPLTLLCGAVGEGLKSRVYNPGGTSRSFRGGGQCGLSPGTGAGRSHPFWERPPKACSADCGRGAWGIAWDLESCFVSEWCLVVVVVVM